MSVETVATKVHPPIDPCPFCGDKGAELEDDEFDHGKGGDGPVEYWVKCGCCGARGPIDRELEAITMWNQRGEHLEEDEP